MLKKVSCVVGLSVALFCSPGFSETYLLTPDLSADFDFPTNAAQVLKNYFFWTITATCNLNTPDSNDEFYVRMLNKSARLNGIKLSKGETMNFVIHNGDRLQISADAGAEVELTNQGQNTVKASCST